MAAVAPPPPAPVAPAVAAPTSLIWTIEGLLPEQNAAILSRRRNAGAYEYLFLDTTLAPQLLHAHPFFHIVEIPTSLVAADSAAIVKEHKEAINEEEDGDDDNKNNNDDDSRIPQARIKTGFTAEEARGIIVRNFYTSLELLATSMQSNVFFGNFWQTEIAGRWTTLLLFDSKCDNVGQATTSASLLNALRERLLRAEMNPQQDDDGRRAAKKTGSKASANRFEQSGWKKYVLPALFNLYTHMGKVTPNPLGTLNAPMVVCSHLFADLGTKKDIKAAPDRLNEYAGWDLVELVRWINTAPQWLPNGTVAPLLSGKSDLICAASIRFSLQCNDVWKLCQARVMRHLWSTPRKEKEDCLDLLYTISTTKSNTDDGTTSSRGVEQTTFEAWGSHPWIAELFYRVERAPPAPWFENGAAWSGWMRSRAMLSDVRPYHFKAFATIARDARFKLRDFSTRQAAFFCDPPQHVAWVPSGFTGPITSDPNIISLGVNDATGLLDVIKPGTVAKQYSRAYICDRKHLEQWMEVARYFGGKHDDNVQFRFIVPWTQIINKGGIHGQSIAIANAISDSWTDEDKKHMPILCLPMTLAAQMKKWPDTHAKQSKWAQAFFGLLNKGPLVKCTPHTLGKHATTMNKSRIIIIHAEMLQIDELVVLMNTLKKWPAANVQVLFTPIGCQSVTRRGLSYDANTVAFLLSMHWPVLHEKALTASERQYLLDAGKDRWTRQIDAWLRTVLDDDETLNHPKEENNDMMDEEDDGLAIGGNGMEAILAACHKRFADSTTTSTTKCAQQQLFVTDFEVDVLSTGISSYPIHPSLGHYVNLLYNDDSKQTTICMQRLDRLNQPLILVSEWAEHLLRGKIALSRRIHPLRLLTLLCCWPQASFACASGPEDDTVKRVANAVDSVITWEQYSAYWKRRRFALAGRCPSIPLQLASDPFFVLQ